MISFPGMNTTIKRWLPGCLLIFLYACGQHSTTGHDPAFSSTAVSSWQQRIDSIKPIAQNGDLIFRNGRDEVSQAARSMNRIDTSFSHCGLVMVENDSVLVYHAIGGHYNPSQKLRRDPIDSFCKISEADRFAVYRYALGPSQQDSLRAIVRRYHQAGLRFDMFFNVRSDDEMYCSEFVFKCLNRSLSGELDKYIQAREWPYGISPDDLFLNEKSRLIKRVDFLP